MRRQTEQGSSGPGRSRAHSGLRRQLTETKIDPAAEGPAPMPPLRQAEAPPARSTKNKRAQADR